MTQDKSDRTSDETVEAPPVVDWTTESVAEPRQFLRLPVGERLVNAHISKMQEETAIRKYAANRALTVFIVCNFVVLLAVIFGAYVDYVFISEKVLMPDQRLISEKVILTIIGATTVQLGAVIWAIYRYLFYVPTTASSSQSDK